MFEGGVSGTVVPALHRAGPRRLNWLSYRLTATAPLELTPTGVT